MIKVGGLRMLVGDRARLAGRQVRIEKAEKTPIFTGSTVLTTDVLNYVSIFLSSRKLQPAVFFWDQAHKFFEASQDLPPVTRPLLLYYSFMNAAKALLSSKIGTFDAYHGLSRVRTSAWPTDILSLETNVRQSGIAVDLASYFGASLIPGTVLQLSELLGSLVYIHRSFCLSTSTAPESFYKLDPCYIVRDNSSNTARLAAWTGDWPTDVQTWLPTEFELEPQSNRPVQIWSKANCPVTDAASGSEVKPGDLINLHASIRPHLCYVRGAEAIWYIKSRNMPYQMRLQSPLVIALAAMHLLSELSRYNPDQLNNYLHTDKAWLINEFITTSPTHYLDQISAEITGEYISTPRIQNI